jgi:nucleotidyltransferase/DNA polymerase involved in DNA repair
VSRTLLYAEVPNFYAEFERASDPRLAGRPVLVGGDPRKRGVVKSATPDARAAGVSDEMPMQEALQLCPRARVIRTQARRYREAAARLHACLRRELERLEAASPGGAYLDASGIEESPLALARRLRERVAAELGLPLRVGIAPVKFVARLAAEESGDEGVRRVTEAELRGFLGPLRVERLPGVGAKTAARLVELGARSVAELAGLERDLLEERLGNHGRTIWALARGQDDSAIRPATHPRSLSQESSFESEEPDLMEISERLQGLAQTLAEALRLERLEARAVSLKLRYADRRAASRRRTLGRPTASAEEILAVADQLLRQGGAAGRPVHGVGIALSGLVRRRGDDRQLPLFPGER